MVRWIFFLLLLANALYLGWQVRQPVVSDAVVIPENVARLRLLKEEDATLLLPRESAPRQVPRSKESALASSESLTPPVKSEAEAQWCQVVSGIAQQSVAIELQQRLQQRGLSASLIPVDNERVLAYELTLDRPLQPERQRALVENLAALGLNAEEAQVDMQPVYVVGRYGSREELNQAKNILIGLFSFDEHRVVSQERLFEVWVEVGGSVETANEIKGVEQFLNSAIKIEKKLCKGVASTGVRD